MSDESKFVLKKIYLRILNEGKIGYIERDLITKFINYGFTTSFTNNSELIFESKKYKYTSSELIHLFIEEIAENIIINGK